MDYDDLTQQLVSRCLTKGATAAEVYLESGRDLNIRVRNGEVETVQESSSRGVGFRVFIEGKLGFGHCNSLSESALDQAIGSATGFAARMTPDEYNILPDDPEIAEVEGLYDERIGQRPMNEKVDLIKKVEALAMGDGRATKSGGSSYSENETEIYIANSRGLRKNYRTSAFRYGVSVVSEKGDQKSNGGESCSRRYYADLLGPESVAVAAVQRAHEMLDPHMIKTQRAAVIFAPEAAGSLLGGLLRAVDGESVLQGASFLRDKKGKKIAVESLTLIDDGIRPKGLSSKPFDGEGVATQKRIIVDGGILQGFMYNTVVAGRAGTRSTGNASRRGYDSLPGIGAHGFYMSAGTVSPEEIVKATRRGVLLKGVTGYGINPVSGDFSGGARGFWIENGAVAHPVKDLTIAGTAAEILNGIDMIGADLDLDRFSAPTFRIREMQIGGA